jgi:hypothetical protein
MKKTFFILFLLNSFVTLISAQKNNEVVIRSIKSYQSICKFYKTDSAVFTIIECETNHLAGIDTTEGFFSKNYILIKDSKSPETKYIFSMKTFVNNDGNLCGVFPANLASKFQDSITLNVKISSATFNLESTSSQIVNYETQIKNIAQNDNKFDDVSLGDEEWIKSNIHVFPFGRVFLNSKGIFNPIYDIRIEGAIENFFGMLRVGFIDFILQDIFQRDASYFEQPEVTSALTENAYLMNNNPLHQLNVCVQEVNVKSCFFKPEINGRTHFFFPINAFDNLRGNTKIYLDTKLIIDEFFIDGDYSTSTSIKRLFSTTEGFNQDTYLITKEDIKVLFKY